MIESKYLAAIPLPKEEHEKVIDLASKHIKQTMLPLCESDNIQQCIGLALIFSAGNCMGGLAENDEDRQAIINLTQEYIDKIQQVLLKDVKIIDEER